jgi:hypothetical protein
VLARGIEGTQVEREGVGGCIIDSNRWADRAAGAEMKKAELHVFSVRINHIYNVACSDQSSGGKQGFA